ncbi:MAG: hypothetical protein WBD20_12145, partial [Pirellulaceae bacterium]
PIFNDALPSSDRLDGNFVATGNRGTNVQVKVGQRDICTQMEIVGRDGDVVYFAKSDQRRHRLKSPI